MIADAAAGHGPRVVLVTGHSGIGKSALLAEAARQADVPVLSAEAFAPDQNDARSLASRILRQAAARLPVPVATLLAEAEASALADVVPGLAVPAGAVLASLDEQNRHTFALQGAVRLIAATAQPRCLLAADDLQWADPTSLTLLGLLLHRLDGVSLPAGRQSRLRPRRGTRHTGLPDDRHHARAAASRCHQGPVQRPAGRGHHQAGRPHPVHRHRSGGAISAGFAVPS